MAKQNKPKFKIGDTVFNKVTKRGSAEPSVCLPYQKLTVDKVEIAGDTFRYTCGYDCYEFMEDELMSKKEYKRSL